MIQHETRHKDASGCTRGHHRGNRGLRRARGIRALSGTPGGSEARILGLLPGSHRVRPVRANTGALLEHAVHASTDWAAWPHRQALAAEPSLDRIQARSGYGHTARSSLSCWAPTSMADIDASAPAGETIRSTSLSLPTGDDVSTIRTAFPGESHDTDEAGNTKRVPVSP